ncbi:hypothetical protein ACXFAU_14115 [Paenibacillus glucanolyticus]
MRNQFHDIILGSSIHEVYEDSRFEYEESEQLALAAIEQGLGGLGLKQTLDCEVGEKGISVRIFNALGWTRSFHAEVDLHDAEKFTWYSAKGARLDAQVITSETADLPALSRVLVEVWDVPAYGYTTIYGRIETEQEQNNPASNNRLEAVESWSIGTDWKLPSTAFV